MATIYCWHSRTLFAELVVPVVSVATANLSHALVESKTTNTTIIINTSLIKSHPSLDFFNATFDSLRHLKGLPDNIPIIITVDGLIREGQKLYRYQPNDTAENRKRLHEYVMNLRRMFKNDKRVQILQSYDAGLLTLNLAMAMEFVDTKYVLVLQHDLRFIKDVDLTTLMESMEDNPDLLKIVRFNHHRNSLYVDYLKLEDEEDRDFCTAQFFDEKTGLHFVPNKFSDMNHITTKEYYVKLLNDLGPTPRFMETAMMAGSKVDKSRRTCRETGQWLYGEMGSGPYIEHLDGKNMENIL